MMMALFCLIHKRCVEEVVALRGFAPPFRPEYVDDNFNEDREFKKF